MLEVASAVDMVLLAMVANLLVFLQLLAAPVDVVVDVGAVDVADVAVAEVEVVEVQEVLADLEDLGDHQQFAEQQHHTSSRRGSICEVPQDQKLL